MLTFTGRSRFGVTQSAHLNVRVLQLIAVMMMIMLTYCWRRMAVVSFSVTRWPGPLSAEIIIVPRKVFLIEHRLVPLRVDTESSTGHTARNEVRTAAKATRSSRHPLLVLLAARHVSVTASLLLVLTGWGRQSSPTAASAEFRYFRRRLLARRSLAESVHCK